MLVLFPLPANDAFHSWPKSVVLSLSLWLLFPRARKRPTTGERFSLSLSAVSWRCRPRREERALSCVSNLRDHSRPGGGEGGHGGSSRGADRRQGPRPRPRPRALRSQEVVVGLFRQRQRERRCAAPDVRHVLLPTERFCG